MGVGLLTGGLVKLAQSGLDLGDPFGGSKAKVAVEKNPAYEALQKQIENKNSSDVQNLMTALGQGKVSYADAVKQAQAMGVDKAQAFQDMAQTNGITGSNIASEFVRNNPLSSGLFGAGGIQDQSQARYGALNTQADQDRLALSGRDQSYGLQDSDLAAYGQASGNIGRMFGGMEQNLAQSLADRGLASAPSGAAGGAFSGLMGNKMEQLAKSQFDIAQARINTAKDLASQRAANTLQQQSSNNSLMYNLGNLGQEAMNTQYGRQLAGAEYNTNQNQAALTDAQNKQIMDQNVANQQWEQQQASSWNPIKTFGTNLAAASGKAGPEAASKAMGSAGGMMMSDERLKTNIEPGADAVHEFLDGLEAYSYDYKDPRFGAGKQIGVMAQDMEKVAPQLVKEFSEGKAIDYGQASGIMMAALVDLHKRIAELEKARG